MASKEKHGPEREIGLGCMRLSTAPDRDEARGIAVIHAALDAGVTLLDSADAYCHDQTDIGHNERLIAKALLIWSGDRSRIRVATKGGLIRPGGAWVPDGRAKHLRAACDASRRSLGVEAIDLYQLHVVDPRTPLETSVRALAALQEAGKVRAVGLSNVTVAQIEAARRIVDVAAVQISLSVLDATNIRNGVVEYVRDHGIEIIAYRPLGGSRGSAGLARDPLLAEIAGRLYATPQEVALAWLLGLAPRVAPIPGATRETSARSIGRALSVELGAADRERLDDRFFGNLLRGSRSSRRTTAGGDGEVVLVMGMPGAGKSTVALELEAKGYQRLNRDLRGGSLSSLVAELDRGLAGGSRRWALDNTYATRSSRNEVLECAWRHGAPARCIWVATTLADAQINAISRLLEAHGRLPSPEELRERGKRDPRYFGPDAQFRFERTLEAPSSDEGFTVIEELRFARGSAQRAERRAVVLEFDGVLVESAGSHPAVLDPDDVRVPPSHVETLARYAREGWQLFAQAWRPQVSSGETSIAEVEACFARTRALLGLDIELGCCPHPAGPPVCWCRKPIPGLVLEFAMRAGVDPSRSVVVGRAAADRTLADRLGATYLEKADFYRP
jgi:aryl-alcohol dehydrogenase-like predicted oxidoreductase/histidinol phosphatase-like enzyme